MMTEAIKDRKGYLEKMRKTYVDKGWFMSIIPDDVTTIVDFGCADNGFCNYLKEQFPQYKYIGIENEPKFTEILRKNGDEYYETIDALVENANINPDNTLLVLNSVIHEVYSYYIIDLFWKDVAKFNPKYIAFRDMYAKGCGIYGSRTRAELEEEIMKSDFLRRHCTDFEDKWGKLIDGYTAVHFLLKYFYDENWAREVKENYLPYHYKELHQSIRKIGYNVTFERFYGLQYLKDKWHKDFNCDEHPYLKTFIDRITTHLKLFMVRETER